MIHGLQQLKGHVVNMGVQLSKDVGETVASRMKAIDRTTGASARGRCS